MLRAEPLTLTVSACPVNMHGTTGVSQVSAALLHGACTLCTNDQQTSSARVWGNFSVSGKLVSESTAAFHAAMEPQPLWTGSLPVCLVEYHQGHSRRLRLVLFFHECGRRVGGVPRSSLKGKETLHDEGQKKNKMEPTNPNANTYVKPLCIKRDTAGGNLFFTL